MGLYMNKIFRFCAAGMLAVAFYGCDTSDSSKPVAPEEEKAQIDDQSSYVWYGEFGLCNGQQRGFAHELCSDATDSWTDSDEGRRCDKICNAYIWAQKVYITPGMVKQRLSFAKGEDGKLNLREPVITKARTACDNKYFEQWFTDNELNKRSEGTLVLGPNETSSAMGLWYDWNNGGFYPLDSVDASTGLWVSLNPQFQNQFGPQSLIINCPPYRYMYAATQTDRLGESSAQICWQWLTSGGPRVGDAAMAAMRMNRCRLTAKEKLKTVAPGKMTPGTICIFSMPTVMRTAPCYT